MTDRDVIAQWLCCGGQCNSSVHGCNKLLTIGQRNRVGSFIAAIAAAGLGIRPLVATKEMILAAMKDAERQGVATDEDSPSLYFGEVYAAMIAAAIRAGDR